MTIEPCVSWQQGLDEALVGCCRRQAPVRVDGRALPMLVERAGFAPLAILSDRILFWNRVKGRVHGTSTHSSHPASPLMRRPLAT